MFERGVDDVLELPLLELLREDVQQNVDDEEKTVCGFSWIVDFEMEYTHLVVTKELIAVLLTISSVHHKFLQSLRNNNYQLLIPGLFLQLSQHLLDMLLLHSCIIRNQKKSQNKL